MLCVKWVVVVVIVMVVVMVVEGKQYCTYQSDGPSPPSQPDVALQYTARIESVQNALSPTGDTIKLVWYDEWIYDAPRNRIAVRTSSKYATNVHLLDWNTKQMIKLSASKEVGKFDNCAIRDLTEGLYLFPVLNGCGEDVSPDKMPDPGVPLGIYNSTITNYKGKFFRRSISSYRWEWCGLYRFEVDLGSEMVSMATYWSVPEWKMPIPTDQKLSIPLGYEVIRWGADVTDFTTPTIGNIVFYEPGLVDESAFLIPPDVFCPHMVPPKGHPFPDFYQETFFSFSLEYRETESKTFTWADAWYDFGKKLYRVDHDVTLPADSNFTFSTSSRDTATTTVTTTVLLDYNDGVAFEIFPGKIGECQVSLISETHGDWSDLTGLDHLWGDSPSAVFGSDVVNYTYYGPGRERRMTVDGWRAMRTDWPPNAVDPDHVMLWQWAFTNKNVSTVNNFGDHVFFEKQVPVGLRVNAQQNINTTEGLIPKGFSILYSIYDFEVAAVGKSVEFNGIRVFDAYDCYSANWRDNLRFKLDVTSWPEVVEKPLITSTLLNEYWQLTLATHGQVSPFRITRVQTIVEEAGEVWVEFTLLGRHWRIGDLNSTIFQNMTSGATARTYLTSAVNKGNIKYEGLRPDGEDFVLLAVAGSLTLVVETECTTTTTTTTSTSTTSTTTPTTTTPLGHTTTTPHNQQTTTPYHKTTTPTPNTPATTPETGDPLYSPGDLAGLGIGMLLIGLALGAGGTFLVVVKGVHHTIMGCCSKG